MDDNDKQMTLPGMEDSDELTNPLTSSTKELVTELLQDAATPDALATAVQDWLDARLQDPARIQRLEQRFTALHDDLQRDTPRLAAHAIQNLLA